MTWLRVLVSRLIGLFRKGRLEQELDDELRSHLEMQVEENVRKGMSPEEARYAARHSFGGVEQVKEIYRERRGLPMFETLFQDLRYGLRMLARNPGFTSIAVVTLALGIGANTAIFSVVNGVVLKPLPYHDPDRLVWLRFRVNDFRYPMSQGHFFAYREENRVFDKMAAFAPAGFNLTGMGEPERLEGANVTLDFFSLLGKQPLHGRAFLPEEDTPGRNLVCILSYGLWQRRFGGDAGVVGRSLTLNDIPTRVVGIMPPDFDFPRQTALWVPVGLDRNRFNPYYLRVLGRLNLGVTISRAEAETTLIGQNFARSRPDLHPKGPDFVTILTPLKQEIVGEIQKPLWILLGAVGFVLLIACANVSNLLLARATLRVREVAVRVSLGASRARLIRQLLTENLLLAALGTAAGLPLAVWGLRLLKHLPVERIPRIDEVGIEVSVLGFAGGIALFTVMLFGLVPALRASRTNLQEDLRESARSGVPASSQHVNHLLIVSQVALSLVLLVGAALLLQSFQQLLEVDPGFRAANVFTMRISLPSQRYTNAETGRVFYSRLLERVRSLPGVRAAGVVSSLPFSGRFGWEDLYSIEGAQHSDADASGLANIRPASPGYFEALGTPLLEGRHFLESDDSSLALIAIVDEALSRKHWPNEGAVGKRIRFGRPRDNRPWMEIVGVVKTVKNASLEEKPNAHLYIPHAQYGGLTMYLAVSTAVEPGTMVAAIRQEVAHLDSQLPLFDVQTMESAIGRSLSPRRLVNLLLTAFAVIGLVLTTVGIYGVVSLSVSSRVHEFGIRMALGARPGNILQIVLRQGIILTAAGITLGVAGSLGLTRLLASLLFGVTPHDPATFVTVASGLAAVAMMACYIPARRATKVDPMVALRCE